MCSVLTRAAHFLFPCHTPNLLYCPCVRADSHYTKGEFPFKLEKRTEMTGKLFSFFFRCTEEIVLFALPGGDFPTIGEKSKFLYTSKTAY